MTRPGRSCFFKHFPDAPLSRQAKDQLAGVRVRDRGVFRGEVDPSLRYASFRMTMPNKGLPSSQPLYPHNGDNFFFANIMG